MRNLCLVLSVVFVIIIGMSPVTHAGEKYQKDGFSITLPGDWKEIPRDVIDAYEEGLAEINPDAARLHYDYGFQFAETENWFEHPYILVQVRSNGRIPEADLAKLDRYPMQESLDSQKEKFKPILSNIQTGKMYFDKKSKIIWARMDMDVASVGRVSCLSGLIPTEKGAIAVNGYALEEDFPKYKPAFQAIVESVAPDQGLVYKPGRPDGPLASGRALNWVRSVGMTLVGAAIGASIGLIISRRKRAAGQR